MVSSGSTSRAGPPGVSSGGFSMMTLLRHLASRFLPTRQRPAVRVSDEDVTLLEGGRQLERFVWSDVQEIVTFKRDLGMYNDIRLAFRVGGDWIEISEDAEGWSALSAAMARRFPMVPPDWYERVRLPFLEAGSIALPE